MSHAGMPMAAMSSTEGSPELPYPKPGEFLVYDFRPAATATTSAPAPLKVLQWNVERNYRSALILSILAELDPDIALLQEIDIGCARSDGRNHMREIAEALKWKGVFVTEFRELDQPPV